MVVMEKDDDCEGVRTAGLTIAWPVFNFICHAMWAEANGETTWVHLNAAWQRVRYNEEMRSNFPDWKEWFDEAETTEEERRPRRRGRR